MSRFHPPLRLKLEDKTAERVRASHDEALRELQAVPVVGGKLIRDIELPDAIDVRVPHSLGRRAVIFLSPPRGGATNTGRITDRTERAGVNEDRSKVVVLRASGWATTITVDAWVF